MKTAKYYSSELSEVDRRGQDRYWDNIENITTQSDRSSESEKMFLMI